MKKIISLISTIALLTVVTTSFASGTEKMKAAGDKIKGAAEETLGGATGDTKLEAKGKLDKLKGAAIEKKEDVKDAVKEKLE